MKKLLSKLGLFITSAAMAIGVGVVAFASDYKEARAEEVALVSLTFPDDNSSTNGVQNYTSTWEAKSGTYLWTVTNFNNGNWGYGWNEIRAVSKNATSIATVTTKSVLGKKINKVVVNITALTAGDINSQKLYVASNSTFTENLQTVPVDVSTGDNTFNIVTPTANQFYKLEYDCKQGTSNGTIKVASITYYYDTDDDTTELDNLEITQAPTKTTYIAGDEFDPTGLKVRANYSDSTHVDLDIEDLTITPTTITAETTKVTISYTDNEITKTVDQAITALTVTDVVSVNTAPLKIQKGEVLDASEVTLNVTLSDDSQAVVTATDVSCDTSAIKTVTATATYSAATGTKTATWQIFVSGPERYFLHTGALEDGDYVFTSDSYALSNTLDGDGRAHNGSFTIDEGTVVNPTADIIWTVKTFTVEDVRYVTIKNKDTDKYLGRSAHLKFVDDVDETEKWYVSEGDTYEFKSSASSSATRLRQNGNSGWGSYNAGVGKSLTLYKHETPTYSVSVPRYEISDNTYKIGKGDSFVVTSELDNGAVGKVTYSLTSGSGISLTDNDDGTATIAYNEAGSGVVKAHLDGCDDITLNFVTVNQLLPISMVVKTAPTKTNYIVGDEFEISGLSVTVTWSDASTSDVSENLVCTGFDSSKKELNQEITINYTVEGVLATATTVVNINYPSITVPEAIEIIKPLEKQTPTAATYRVTGKVVSKEWSGNSTEGYANINIAVKYNEQDPEKIFQIYHALQGDKDTFNLIQVGATIIVESKLQKFTKNDQDIYETVANPDIIDFDDEVGKLVTGVSVHREPDNKQYYVGDTEFDYSGTVMYIHYNTGSGDRETVRYDDDPTAFLEIFEFTDPDTSDSKAYVPVTITHKETGFSDSFNVSVSDVKPSSISVTKNPTKTTYASGEEFEPDGIEVTVKNNNGSEFVADSSKLTYRTIAQDGKVYEGDTYVTVIYDNNNNLTKSIPITVTPKYITGISATLSEGWNDDTYDIGGTFNTKSLVIHVNYNDGSFDKYNSKNSDFSMFTITPPDMSTAGDKNVAITYTSGGDTFITTVLIHIKGVEELSIDQEPYRLVYRVGDELNFNGLKLTALYNTAEVEDVDPTWDNVTITGDTSKDGPNQKITFTYKGASAYYEIDVWLTNTGREVLIKSEIAKLKNSVKASDYTDENWATVQDIISTLEDSLSDYDASKDGQHYSSDVLEEIDAAKELIAAVPLKNITKIELIQPTKTTYNIGEELDLTGFMVIVYFENGTMRFVTADACTITGFDSSTAGTKTVKVTYSGFDAEFKVTVIDPAPVYEKTLENITIAGPTKTTYEYGEELNTAGLVVTAHYSDNTTATVTNVTVTGYNRNQSGQQTITVSYTEGGVTKTATFTVTVGEEPVDPAVVEEARTEAIAELNDFFDSIDLTGYSAEVIAQFNAAKQQAMQALGGAATEEEIATALANAKAALNALINDNPKPTPTPEPATTTAGASAGLMVLMLFALLAVVIVPIIIASGKEK